MARVVENYTLIQKDNETNNLASQIAQEAKQEALAPENQTQANENLSS